MIIEEVENKTRGKTSIITAWHKSDDFPSAMFALIAGIYFGALSVHLVHQFYHPSVTNLINEATELLRQSIINGLAPEPVERMQYIVCAFTVPIIIISVYTALEYWRNHSPSIAKHIRNTANALLALATLLAPALAYYSFKNSDGEFLHIRSGALFISPWIHLFTTFPATIALLLYSHKKWVLTTGRAIVYPIGIFVLVTVFFSVLYNHDIIWRHHLNPVIFPLAQVMVSKTLLVDCAPLYGLYPHFLEPIFRLITLDVYSFTVVMGLLLLLSIAAQWFFLRGVVKNELLLVIGLIAINFYSNIGAKISVILTDPYFQYAPIRTLFPCLILMGSMAYIRNPSSRFIYLINFLIVGAGILWNPDSGGVAFLAWFFFLCYCELVKKPVKIAALPIVKHALCAFATLLVAYLSYSFFALFRSGSWPDWEMSARYYKIFSYYGFFMLPMKPLPHLWGLLALIYATSMTISIRSLVRKRDDIFSKALFMLTLLGVGLFAYYQGRSHDQNLFGQLYIPLVIMVILVDHVLENIRQGSPGYFRFAPVAAIGIYFLSSAPPSVAIQNQTFLQWIKRGADSTAINNESANFRNISFIRENTESGEKILILIQDFFDGIYHAESQTASILDLPSSTDYFFKSDHAAIIDFLLTNKTEKIFTIPEHFPGLKKLFSEYYDIIHQDLHTGITLYQPRTRKNTSKSIIE
jgi:hypothetical protein